MANLVSIINNINLGKFSIPTCYKFPKQVFCYKFIFNQRIYIIYKSLIIVKLSILSLFLLLSKRHFL